MPDILETIAAYMKQQNDILAALSNKANVEKAAATTQTATPLHGSGGIFQGPGLERDVITAHIRPLPGLAAELPWFPSVMEDPRFPSLTGYTAVTGDEPTNACEDAPTGYMKGCNLTARFGLLRRDTQTIEMDKVMRRVNRGDFTDLVLRGSVLNMNALEPSGMSQEQILDVLTMSEMVQAAVNIERLLATMVWQGVITTANQFPGLDVQIATGQSDADTGTLCPALDSDVKNYNYALVSETIVTNLSMLEWYLRWNARQMGLEPVTWRVVMRPELWQEISAIWPCAYNTNRCAGAAATGSQVFIDGRENTRDRDAMRSGNFIDINGSRYGVVLDDGVYEHNSTNNANLNPGQYASGVYMVPLTITGGFPVTYMEYLDYRKAQPDVSLLRGMQPFFWTDSGRFSWAFDGTYWCYKLALKIEPRVVLRTPQLAGRIDAVAYEPLQHLRSSDPSSSYWADGGVSLRGSVGTPYAAWGSR